MAASVLIRGARILDPSSGRDEVGSLLVDSEGRIAEIGKDIKASESDTEVIDARGRWLTPGFIDLHTHLREPGFEYRETVATGSASAAAGGFTTILCMANTEPINDTGAVTQYIRELAATCGLVDVKPIGALSRGLAGKHLAEIGDMVSHGAVAMSDDGLPVMDAHLMRRALEYSRIFDIPVIAHEEDSCLSHGGVMNEGLVSTELGLKGMPNAAEDVMVARDIILSETTGGHLHVAHVSTAHSVDLIRQAKAKGLRVTTEVTPHHFTLCDTEVRGYHPDSKMAPPLRTEADRLAILEGMQDGTIDCIATDHAPHSTADKDVEFELSNFGIVGLETAWGLTYRLVQEGVLDLLAALALLTSGPAGIFGLDAGSLAVGSRADLCLIDPRAKQEVQRHTLHSKSKNTPFLGWSLDTRIERTLFGGRTVFRWTEAGGETYPLSR